MEEMSLLNHSGGPVTRSRIKHDLADLGLKDGDVVIFHTRMSAIGYVAGGTQTIIGALLDVVGVRGTLMVPCGWNNAPPYDFLDWPRDWQDALRAEHPAYDPDLSEADYNNGRLPEALRRWPGAIRSRHPDASFAALGPAAAELMAEHPWDHPHGSDTPLARLIAHSGRVLLLGAPLDTMTLLHHAEALADVRSKRFVTYEQPILVNGQRVWRQFRDIDSEEGAFDYSTVVRRGVEPFEAIARDMLSAGIGRQGRVGAADSYLFEAEPVFNFAINWIEAKLKR
ncbi:aminoglycoside 3-N-acetyltransferase [Micromonospora tulbaghiae]|nr:aminoglycoside 3-N-acetyltransferase [Micromonospora tulbaghiae]